MKKRTKSILALFFFVFALTFCLWGWRQYQEVRGPGIPVLLYHRVTDNGPVSKYKITSKQFLNEMKWLHEHGYKTILPKSLINSEMTHNPRKTVIISFDDGTEGQYENALPTLKKFGFKGLFFIISGFVNDNGCMSSKQIKGLVSDGMEIGSHTVTHPYLDEISHRKVVEQLKKSKNTLQKISNQRIWSFAPPGGWYNNYVENQAKLAGYRFFFTCNIGLNNLKNKPFLFNRIEVLRGISIGEFSRLLKPKEAFGYKMTQACKFLLHDLIGTSNYAKLSHII